MKKLIIFTLCLLLFFSSNSLAAGSGIMDYFLKHDTTPDIDSISSGIYSVLYAFGVILAVCIMTVMAIQWFLATPGKKAVLKERFIYYFAGVIFLVGGVSFLNWYEGAAKKAADTFASSGGPSYEQDSKKNIEGNTAEDIYGYTDGNGKYHYYNNSAENIKVALNLSLSKLNKMTYDEVKEYTNALSKNISDYKKAIKNGEIPETSGSEQQLENAEERYKYAKKLLAEKLEQTEIDDMSYKELLAYINTLEQNVADNEGYKYLSTSEYIEHAEKRERLLEYAKNSLEEKYDFREVADDTAETIIDKGAEEAIKELDEKEIEDLLGNLTSLSENQAKDLDISYLIENFDALTSSQQEQILGQQKDVVDATKQQSTSRQSIDWDEGEGGFTLAELQLLDWYEMQEAEKQGKEYNPAEAYGYGEPSEWSQEEHQYMKKYYPYYYQSLDLE